MNRAYLSVVALLVGCLGPQPAAQSGETRPCSPTWQSSSFDRRKSAIEDYVPSVKTANAKALGVRWPVLDGHDGHIARMGVVHTSGVSGFDIAALDTVDRAPTPVTATVVWEAGLLDAAISD
jgi:hypothetical protein